jgi:hypothetical protein
MAYNPSRRVDMEGMNRRRFLSLSAGMALASAAAGGKTEISTDT